MVPSYQSALATAGASGGLGLSSLLQGLSDGLSAPRRYVWDKLGLGNSGADLVDNIFGGSIDSQGVPGMILGNAAEMALDPLNLLMMGSGGLAGKVAGKGLDISKGLAASKTSLAAELAALTGEKAALGEVGSIAKGVAEAPQALANWPSPNSPLWKVPDYDRLLGETTIKRGADMFGRKYNRVAPEAMAALEKSGMGVPVQGTKGAVMTMDARPNFLLGKGGTMQLDPTRMVPEYAASFGQPTKLAEMFGPGESRLASLSARLGDSADLLHSPFDELAGTVAKRLELMGGDEAALTSALGEIGNIRAPFNISANPRINEHLAQAMATSSAGGVGAAMIPGLFRTPAPRPPMPDRYEQIPVMPQEIREQLAVMPDLDLANEERRRREEIARMRLAPKL